MHRNLYRLFALAFGFILATHASAQNPIHDVLTTRDGLPSDQVYGVHQDQKGNMWFCTDNGVARFDGLNMKTYRLEEGLPDNVVFMMREDPKGRLWFSTYSGGVFYIERDSVVIPSFNKDLTEKLSSHYLKYLHIDEHDSIFMINHHYEHGLFKAHINDPTAIEIPIEGFLDPNALSKAKDLNGFFVNLSKILGKDFRQKGFLTFKEFGLKDQKNSFLAASAFMKSGIIRKTSIERDGSSKWIANAAELALLTKKGLKYIRTFPSQIHYVKSFDDELLITTAHHGFYRFSIEDPQNGTLKLLGRHHWNLLANVTMDNSGAYWICTLENGVIRMPDPNNLRLAVAENIELSPTLEQIHFSDDTIYSFVTNKARRETFPESMEFESYVKFLDAQPQYNMSELRKDSSLWNDNQLEHFYTMFRDSARIRLVNHRATVMFASHNPGWFGKYIYNSLTRISYRNNNEPLRYEFIRPAHKYYRNKFTYSRRKFASIPGHFILCFNRGFIELTMDSMIFNGLEHGISEPVTTVLRLGDTHYLYGTHEGLFEYQNQGPSLTYRKSPLLNFRIETLDRDQRGLIYAGTRGGGLVVIGQDSIFRIGELDGLSNNYIRRSTLHNDTLWLATDNGLSMVYVDDQLRFNADCHWLNDLSSYNPISNLAINKDEITIFKDNSFHFIKRNYKGKVQAPRVIMEEALLSGRTQDPAQEGKVYSVSGRNNNLEFNFRINGLLSDPFVRYQYRLKGYEDEWTTTKERQVSYQNIPYGSYSFEVRAINAHNMQSANTASFGVDILKPIFMQLWFQILIGLSFIGLSLLIVNIYFKRKNKRLLQEKAMISSNIFALKMQINPHFIFNALNSIQYFIASNQGRPANEFLTKFSKLIRDILTKANQTKVTLEEELKSLRNYIELEETRTKGTLQWSLEVEEGIDQKRIFIPSMVIQPIVENAIWHGLSKADMDPTMLIRIYRDGNILKCEVQDNGPGIPLDRVGTGESGARQLHRSVGLSNVIQRLELISKMEGKSYTIDFGHVNPEEEYKGTRVVIGVPVG